MAESGLFMVEDRVTVPWTRELSVDDWLTDQSSHSYVADLSAAEQGLLFDALREPLDARFPGGRVTIPYETWLWIGHKL